jgi:hypothetical protein
MESKGYLIHVCLFEWLTKLFRDRHEELEEDSRSRWPSGAKHLETAAKVHEMATTI